MRYSATGTSAAVATASAHPKRPALSSPWLGGHCALASEALKVAGTENVATVQGAAAWSGHPLLLASTVKLASAVMSASPDSDTEDVPTASSSDASATIDGLALELQSKVIFVVPAVTPRMKEPATVPVPADTVTLHEALAARGRCVAAEAVATEMIVRPLTRSRAVAPTAIADLIGRRRPLIFVPVESFIGSISSSRKT